MTNRGAVLKMAPLGKSLKKWTCCRWRRSPAARTLPRLSPNNPRRVESVIKKAVLIAREVGSTYIQPTPLCNIEYAQPTRSWKTPKTLKTIAISSPNTLPTKQSNFSMERYGYKGVPPVRPCPGCRKA